MYVKRRYPLLMAVLWSKKGFLYGGISATVAVIGYQVFDQKWIAIPFQPIALVGTALAFYLGFKNNSSYDRLWEARKIWGSIVNNSRAFATMVTSYISNLHADKELSKSELDEIKKRLIYRHLAWLTSLRYLLRTTREWEHKDRIVDSGHNVELRETAANFEKDMLLFCTPDELREWSAKSNKPAHVLKKQSDELAALRDRGLIDDFRHIELHKMINLFYEDQGKSERIKNFPFPRQYSSVTTYFIIIFSVFLGASLLSSFKELGPNMVWLTIPFASVVSWVFIMMEMIGDYSENPFEGGYNDVPITTIARSIEIDLREMISDRDIPAPMKDQSGFLM